LSGVLISSICILLKQTITFVIYFHFKLCLLALSVICWIYILRIPFCLVPPPIVFSFRTNPCFYLGTICRWTLNGINLKIPHWRFNVNRHTHIIVYWCKYWVALNPGLVGVGSNQIEAAIFSYAHVVLFGFQSSLFIYYTISKTNRISLKQWKYEKILVNQ
jgi:hypothetical protein